MMEQIAIFDNTRLMKSAILFSALSLLGMSIVEFLTPAVRAVGQNVHFWMFWGCFLVIVMDTFLGVRAAHKRYEDGKGEQPSSKAAKRMLGEKFAVYGIAVTFGGLIQALFLHAGVDNKVFGIPLDPIWASWAFILYVEGWSYRENIRELGWKLPPVIAAMFKNIFKKEDKK